MILCDSICLFNVCWQFDIASGSLHRHTMIMFSTTTVKVKRELGSIGHELLFQLAQKWTLWEEISICLETNQMTYSCQAFLLIVALPQILVSIPKCHILVEWNLPYSWMCQILCPCPTIWHLLTWMHPVILKKFQQLIMPVLGDNEFGAKLVGKLSLLKRGESNRGILHPSLLGENWVKCGLFDSRKASKQQVWGWSLCQCCLKALISPKSQQNQFLIIGLPCWYCDCLHWLRIVCTSYIQKQK